MKCQGFWGLADSPPHKYIIEFKKEEVEKLLLMPYANQLESFEYFGQQVWDILVAEYERHNKGIDK